MLSYFFVILFPLCATISVSFAAPYAERRSGVESTTAWLRNIESEPVVRQSTLELQQELAILVCPCLFLSAQQRTLTERGSVYLATVCMKHSGVQASFSTNKSIIRAGKQRSRIVFFHTQRDSSEVASKVLELIAHATKETLFYWKSNIERRLGSSRQLNIAEEGDVCGYSFVRLTERMSPAQRMFFPRSEMRRRFRLLMLIRGASRPFLLFVLARINARLAELGG